MVRIDFNRLRFLIIDDNAHMRRIMRQLLHGFGTREVYEAEDGAAGLEAFTHYMPDIVITDWAMPIFDGLELTHMLRRPGPAQGRQGRRHPPAAAARQGEGAGEGLKEGRAPWRRQRTRRRLSPPMRITRSSCRRTSSRRRSPRRL